MSLFSNRRHSAPQPLTNNQPQILPFFIVLGVCFISVWLVARLIEQIDLSETIPLWYTAVSETSMPALLVFIRELFSWRVLRHLLPIFVGWYIAYQVAVGLVRTLYDLPDKPAARRFLSQLIYTGSAATMPPVALNSDLLEIKRDQYVALRIGGPGRIQVRSGYVAVTELNGRFHHILGTGKHQLERFEYVHNVLDLRLQERTDKVETLISKDGIPISAHISLQFRIATGGESPTRTKPFPFDETAVKIAAYNQTVREDGLVSSWDSAPLSIAKTQLARIISKHNVDALLTPPHTNGNGATATPLVAIRNDLTRNLREILQNKGIELIDVQLSQIELPDDVTTQYIKYWQSQSNARIKLSQADGEAAMLEEKELAQAEAEMTMIQAILEGVQRAKLTHNVPNMRDVVALRLVEALEKMAIHSQQVAQLPSNSSTVSDDIGRLRDSLNRYLPMDNDLTDTEDEDE